METGMMVLPPRDLTAVGQAANGYAAKGVFEDYRQRKADNTLRTQRAALALFARFLLEADKTIDGKTDKEEAKALVKERGAALASDPQSWRGVTWGLVEAFRRWLLLKGYRVDVVNNRLSAVKTYAQLAAKAGDLDRTELAMIRTVKGFSQNEGRRVDEKRAVTSRGHKKAEAVVLTAAQLRRLKKQPGTPQGRRDRVIITLLADHGLRCGELALLDVTAVNLETGMMTFYRPKVGFEQTHELTPDARKALAAYIEAGDAPAMGRLLRASTGAQRLTDAGMSERSITERVRYLASLVGIEGLSAHDLRHTWATLAARAGTPIDRLMDGGGWASESMPMRYIQRAKIANEGVRLE